MIPLAAILYGIVKVSPALAAHEAKSPALAIPIRPEMTLCSVDASDMEPAKILRLLSKQTGVNLVLLGTSDAKLTLRLSASPLIEVVKHISAMTGMTYLKVGETFVIGIGDRLKAAYPDDWKEAHPESPAPPPAPQVERITETYRTSYVGAEALAQAIDKVYGKGELQIVAGPASSSPTVSSLDSSKATGTSSMTLESAAGSASVSRLVVLEGPRPLVEKALALARQLDTARAQVQIAVTVHDISNDALRDLGISWTINGFNVSEKPSGFNIGSVSRTGLSAAASIKALETSDRAKLMASPSISVLDGERGFVLIGNRINFPVLVGYTQSNSPIFDRQEERVGIYLQVAANVAADGSVTLSLYPQVSTITGYLEVNGASYPQIATREAQTTVRVKSGESVVLGGLIRDEEVTNFEKIPLLGDVPLFGELFKRRKKTHNSNQVILTVTPTIVPPETGR